MYTGNFDTDEKNGFGLMQYKNGDVYKGEWKNGVRSGKGEY